jgi:VanZ family protein
MGISRALWRWMPPVLYLAVVLRISLIPTVPKPAFVGLDKLEHIAEFAALGVLLARDGRGGPDSRTRLTLIIVGLLAAAVDELIQAGVVGRHSSVWDFLADSVGVMIGVRFGPRLWRWNPMRRFA